MTLLPTPKSYLRTAAIFLLFLQGSGCSTFPSPETRQQVTAGVSLPEVFAHPLNHLGQTIVVAGPIVSLDNRKDGALLKIHAYQATEKGLPVNDLPPLGLLYLATTKTLDASVYHPGQPVAAAGRIIGQRPVSQAQHAEQQPLLQTLELEPVNPHPGYSAFPIRFGIGVMGGI